MPIKVAHSSSETVSGAVADIKAELGKISPTLVLFFSTSKHEPQSVAQEVHAAFPEAQTIGCTTAGELVSGHMLKNSLVAMAFGRDTLRQASVAVLTDLGPDKEINLGPVENAFEGKLGTALHEMDPSRFLGLVLTDGLSIGEEKVMEKLGDVSNVPFVGGSAGDDVAFVATHVFANGEAYRFASVLALLEPSVPFQIIKTQSFKVMPKTLRVTKVDESTRTVFEFNGKPAAQAYADALDVDVDKLTDHFMSHPLGLMVGDNEPFVRSPQQVVDGAVKFYCAVREGMELSLLETGDIVADTRSDLEKELAGVKASGMVNFHCILRTLQLESSGQTEQYGKLFTDVPMIGFSTYGESYVAHINQTSTIVVFR